MLTKPTNWDTYKSDPNHYYESVLRVGNSEYSQDDIMSLTASQNLYGDEYSVGGVCMGQYDATLIGVTADDIPKFSRAEVWTRLCKDSTHKTSFVPKGVFYTKKPSYDPESSVLTISGYDEMFRTEQIPFAVGSQLTAYSNPSVRQMAKHIVEGIDYTGALVSNWNGIGLTLEDETQISNTITVSAPPYGYTVREILKDIAIACGGNWTIAFSGTYPNQVAKLRLIEINKVPSYEADSVLATENQEVLAFGNIGISI